MSSLKSTKPKEKGGGDEKKTQNLYRKFLDFLNSPVWAMPVMSFIEQRSTIFDKDGQSNEQEYRKVHAEFRDMIDVLINCFCEDLKTHPAELIDAIQNEKGKGKSSVEMAMLEPVVAANEFQVFVHMMARKNVELQLQALQMIEFMCGLIPAVLVPTEGDEMLVLSTGANASKVGEKKTPDEKKAGETASAAVKVSAETPEERERMILMQVMKESKEEFEREQQKRSAAQKELEEQLKETLAVRQQLESERSRHDNLVEQAMKRSLEGGYESGSEPKQSETSNDKATNDPSVDGDTGGETVSSKPKRGSSAKKRPGSAIKKRPGSASRKPNKEQQSAEVEDKASKKKTAAEIRALMKDEEKPTDAAVKARGDYLKQQRDRLLAMKKVARESALQQSEGSGKSQRPRTAKAARSAMRGAYPEANAQQRAGATGVSDEVLAVRRALAAKLKQEVISTASRGQ